MNESEISDFFGTSNQDNQNDSNIIIEEGLDCRRNNMRFFNLINRQTKLSIMISHDSTILNCRLGDHDIVIHKAPLEISDREAASLGDRSLAKNDKLAWNCHVRGNELTITNSNNSSIKIFELMPSNELICYTKLRTLKTHRDLIYFNLNDAKDLTPIDDHTILVQCNGNLGRIKVEEASRPSIEKSSILPKSFIGEIPFHLTQHKIDHSEIENIVSENLIVCDAIFSLDSASSLDYLQVQVRYMDRLFELEIRSITSISFPPKTEEHPTEASSSSTSCRKLSELDSTSKLQSSTNAVDNSDRVCLKFRVRVTNFGFAITPISMKNYQCKYRFSW